MDAKERIAELEIEVDRLKGEVALIERAKKLEQEVADLKRRIAGEVLPAPWFPGGRKCSCGVWVPYGSYHTCSIYRYPASPPPYTQSPLWGQTGSSQTSPNPHQQYTINSITQGIAHKGTTTLLHFGEDPNRPPDDGVPARI